MRIVGFCLRLLGGLVLAALVALLFGWIVQLLWNWLMPALFHLPIVTFWQAAGLVFLSRLLFGHVGGRPHGKKWKHCGRKRSKDCCRGKSDRPSAFAPGGDIANWEHFDEWWENSGKERCKSSTGKEECDWGWWKWWKTEGRPEYERWLDARDTKD